VVFPLNDFVEATMLTELFPIAHRRYTESSTAPWLRGFSEWLVAQGYSRKATRGHVLRLRQALERPGSFSPDESPTSDHLTQLFAFPTRQEHYRATEHNFRRYLIGSDRLCLTCEAEFGRFTPLLVAYRKYLLELRGLVAETVKHHLATAHAFLDQAVAPTDTTNTLSAQSVESFVVAAGQRLKRQTLQQTVGHLRVFLRFCHDRGEIPKRLDAIDTPRIYRGELPPRALSWNHTLALLGSIDRTDMAGCRDHAILYLMAHFGLRPSEVALLKRDSIDWASLTLRVEQCKTRSSLVLPLSKEALHLLQCYLRDGRSDSSLAALFLRLRAPARALTSSSIRAIYKRRARQSGLPLKGSSAYSLRHGFAMRLLERGVGIKVIGDLLGHRALASTCVYLRLQTEALREVGLSLPDLTPLLGDQHERP
jgi:integrase/recombinase XerD